MEKFLRYTLAALLLLVCTPRQALTASAAPPPLKFVQRTETGFKVGGSPLTFLGVNRYELAGGPQTGACRKWGTLQQWLPWAKARIDDAGKMGANVIRIWAFQNFAGPNGNDFMALDQVIAYAKKKRIRIIPVLENQWADCTEGGIKDSAWFRDGHRRPYGRYKLSFDAYLASVVRRYKEEPAIAMWQVINEGKNYQDPRVMQQFLAQAARHIKAIDKNHLVSGGAAIQCWQGNQGAVDFLAFNSDPSIDVLDAHSYDDDHAPWPVCMSDALQAAKVLRKPLIIGESGMRAGSHAPETRARLLSGQTQEALKRGASGYLIWSIGEVDGGLDGFDVAPDGPCGQILKIARRR